MYPSLGSFLPNETNKTVLGVFKIKTKSPLDDNPNGLFLCSWYPTTLQGPLRRLTWSEHDENYPGSVVAELFQAGCHFPSARVRKKLFNPS